MPQTHLHCHTLLGCRLSLTSGEQSSSNISTTSTFSPTDSGGYLYSLLLLKKDFIHGRICLGLSCSPQSSLDCDGWNLGLLGTTTGCCTMEHLQHIKPHIWAYLLPPQHSCCFCKDGQKITNIDLGITSWNAWKHCFLMHSDLRENGNSKALPNSSVILFLPDFYLGHSLFPNHQIKQHYEYWLNRNVDGHKQNIVNGAIELY